MVVPSFQYLNEKLLDSYVAFVEGGIADTTRRRNADRSNSSKGVKATIKGLAGGQYSKGADTESEHEREIRDTPEARFSRLITAFENDPDRYHYEEVLEPEALRKLRTGIIIKVDCEVEVPQFSRMLSQPDKLGDALNMIEALGPAAKMFNPNAKIPEPQDIQAMRTFSTLQTDMMVVGVVNDEQPKLAGKLIPEFLRDEMMEDEVTIIGKVRKIWDAGQSHSLLTLPGASLLSREQRRNASEKLGAENMLHGPALTLDILAIYR